MPRGIRGRGPYNAPFFTCRFCPSKMGWLKNDCFSETEVDFFFLIGPRGERGRRGRKTFMRVADSGYSQAACRFNDGVAERLEYRETCLAINNRLFLPLAFFPSAFFPVSALSSAFCVPSFLSEALGFSTGNTRVVTVTLLWFSFPFSQFTFGTFAISVFSSFEFGFVGCFWLCWASFLQLGTDIGF